MENLVGSTIGLIHLIASILALLFGTMVLLMRKGTRKHRRVGYMYVTSMIILLMTSFMTFRLFGGFGLFHYASVLSSLTLIFGIIPVLRRKSSRWLYQHLSFMYWSVIGLYAAFASEALTRIPKTPFFGMVGIATVGITILGAVFFARNKNKWQNIFKHKSST